MHTINLTNEIMTRWLNFQHNPLMKNFEDYMSTKGLWIEAKGIFITAPRQSGKTTALCNVAKMLLSLDNNSDVIIAAPYEAMIKGIKNKVNSNVSVVRADNINLIRGLNHSNYHLLVDEYKLADKAFINNVLEYKWKSVIMIGTGI